MLVLMWLLVGAAALCLESGLLSLNVFGVEPLSSGQYVSPFGALQFDLGVKKKLPVSSWPWAQESLAGALEQASVDAAKGPVNFFFKPLTDPGGFITGKK